jgi:hypothetical protein
MSGIVPQAKDTTLLVTVPLASIPLGGGSAIDQMVLPEMHIIIRRMP